MSQDKKISLKEKLMLIGIGAVLGGFAAIMYHLSRLSPENFFRLF